MVPKHERYRNQRRTKNQFINDSARQSQIYMVALRCFGITAPHAVHVCALTLVFIVMIFFDLECAPSTHTAHSIISSSSEIKEIYIRQPKCQWVYTVWMAACDRECVRAFDLITSACRSEKASRNRIDVL